MVMFGKIPMVLFEKIPTYGKNFYGCVWEKFLWFCSEKIPMVLFGKIPMVWLENPMVLFGR